MFVCPLHRATSDLWSLTSASPAVSPTPAIPDGPDIFSLYRAPVADHHGRVYAIKSRVQEMEDWDGARWELHPCPEHRNALTDLSVDNQDRVWGFTYEEVLIWDPSTKQWTPFANLRAALEAMLQRDPRLSFPENDRWVLTFSGDGRVAYWTYHPEKLAYFDGKKWREWPKAELVHGRIQFDEKGKLRVMGYNQSLRFDGQKWEATQDKVLSDPIDRRQNIRWDLTGSSEPSVIDDQDVIWFTKQRRLYRQLGKLRVAVFKENESNAFSDGRTLRNVTPDNHGNVFLYTDCREECVLVRPKSPPPRTELEVAVKEDAIVAHLHTNSSGKHWFEWRLDQGKWSEPEERTEVAIEPVPNGRHTLEARAVDENLQVDPQGARQSFDVAVDYPKRVRTALDKLRDPAQREQAVHWLVRSGPMALPALRERRGQADDDERWWIDAAMQEIERHGVKQPASPSH